MDRAAFTKVCVGSGSRIKIEATQEAFGPSAEVVAFAAAESGVPPQPVGRAQTEEGARNRAAGAMAHCPDAAAWVAFENGMWPLEAPQEGYVAEDAACVVVVTRKDPAATTPPTPATTDTHVLWSAPLPIPKDLPFEGGPNGEWSVLKDPHAVLTDGAKPRKQFLVETLNTLFRS